MNKIFLITGGNIGNRKKNLETAATLIEKRIGKIINRSNIYETEAWGTTNQPSFYNQVLLIESKLPARKILDTILNIESEMGRIRTVKNAARSIDIDILFFNDSIINEEYLTIPHPEISNRKFVLVPLNEIASQMLHPVFKKTLQQLLAECKDPLKVISVDE